MAQTLAPQFLEAAKQHISKDAEPMRQVAAAARFFNTLLVRSSVQTRLASELREQGKTMICVVGPTSRDTNESINISLSNENPDEVENAILSLAEKIETVLETENEEIPQQVLDTLAGPARG